MIVSCLVLVWLFGSQPAKKVEPIPTDGLIEAVASVQESMQDPPAPSPSDRHEKARREIVIFSIEGCRDCDTWKRCEQPKFEADGWTVVKSNDPMKGPWPHFLIDANNKQTEYRGYLPFEKISEVVK